MGAQVTVLDVRAETMAYLEDVFGGAIETLYSNPTNIEQAVSRADLVVGAVLVTGAVAPKLVTEQLVSRMEKGSVIVDVVRPVTRELLWRGEGRAALSDDPSENVSQLMKTAAAIIAKFPKASPRTVAAR